MKYIHRLALGDNFHPLGRRLRRGANFVDLTGLTVQIKIKTNLGVVLLDWTDTGITVITPQTTSTNTGKVQYDFTSSGIVAAGRYCYWFRVGDGVEWSTFPPNNDGELLIVEEI